MYSRPYEGAMKPIIVPVKTPFKAGDFLGKRVFLGPQVMTPGFFEVFAPQFFFWGAPNQKNMLFTIKTSKHVGFGGSWYTRWWFQIIFYFHPYLGKISNLTNIFHMGGSTTNQMKCTI